MGIGQGCEKKNTTYHGPESDQPDQRKLWEEAQADDNGIPKGLEILGVEARINYEKKYRRHLCWAAKRIFDGSVFW
jgi:hypothetical protein